MGRNRTSDAEKMLRGTWRRDRSAAVRGPAPAGIWCQQNLGPPQPLKFLSPRAKRIFRDVVRSRPELTEADAVLLSAFAGVMARSHDAAEIVAKEGLMIGGKVHPAVKIQTQATREALRLHRDLKL